MKEMREKNEGREGEESELHAYHLFLNVQRRISWRGGRGGGILESKNNTGRCKIRVLESHIEKVKDE